MAKKGSNKSGSTLNKSSNRPKIRSVVSVDEQGQMQIPEEIREEVKINTGDKLPIKAMGCCKVQSVISVDERGQMVLPKEIRELAKINAGDKFAVISWEKDGKVCCISLIKVEELEGMVKSMLGPIIKEILK